MKKEIRQVPLPIIDFDNPPLKIEDYDFGERLTRNNFVHFLIDSFAKSRGNEMIQAHEWKWLGRNSQTDVPVLMKEFLERGGYQCLSNDEKTFFEKFFNGISKHEIVTRNTPVGKPFSIIANSGIKSVLRTFTNLGHNFDSIESGERVQLKPLREDVLNLNKDDFLRWQATSGRNENLSFYR